VHLNIAWLHNVLAFGTYYNYLYCVSKAAELSDFTAEEIDQQVRVYDALWRLGAPDNFAP